MTVALSDGTIARSGGKVIKNVAGYDLAKLFCGSFGTLGLILSVSVRLHPLPPATATALGASSDPGTRWPPPSARWPRRRWSSRRWTWPGAAAGAACWPACGGAEAARRAKRVAQLMRELGLEHADVAESDAELWARQRAGQRSAPARAGQAGRAPEPAGRDAARGRRRRRHARRSRRPGHELRRGRSGRGGAPARSAADRASTRSCSTLRRPLAPNSTPGGRRTRWRSSLMQRVKERFDPAQACNPGVFVGGI